MINVTNGISAIWLHCIYFPHSCAFACSLSPSSASSFISLENSRVFFCSFGAFYPHILFRTGATLAKAEGTNVTLIQIDSWAFNLLFKVISHRVKLENDCECNSFELMKDNRSKLSKIFFVHVLQLEIDLDCFFSLLCFHILVCQSQVASTVLRIHIIVSVCVCI